MQAAAQRRGGDGTLVPGAHSKQGQKVHPYKKCGFEKGQRKLSPKKADWKKPWKQIKHPFNYYEAARTASSKTQT